MVVATTHSNVAIDLISRQSDCQIIHVTHDGAAAQFKTVTSHMQRTAVLDDLDARASDLLQSTCVLWVEGPSDRTYISRWIEIASAGQLQEGLHYRCVFYGGKLLKHLSAADPDEQAKGIALLRVNRHCCIVIDRDRANADEPINETKQRLVAEIAAMRGVAWVTEGREIEKYLPAALIDQATASVGTRSVGAYEQFEDYLGSVAHTLRTKFIRSKAEFADAVVDLAAFEAGLNVLDVSQRLNSIMERICDWNGMEHVRWQPAAAE